MLRFSGTPGAVPAAAGRRAGAEALGDEHLAAVLDLGRQVDLAQVRARGRSAGAADRVVDPRARAHAVDARRADRAGHVDGDRAAPLAAAVHPDRRRRPTPALAATAAREVPRAEQGNGDDGERAGGELARGEIGHGSKLRGAA